MKKQRSKPFPSPSAIMEKCLRKYRSAFLKNTPQQERAGGQGWVRIRARLIANAHGGDISMQNLDGIVCVRVLLPES